MIEKSIIKFVNHKIIKDNIKIICIDGISCSGKTYFSLKLYEELKKKNYNVQLISKDLFLYPRNKRINKIPDILLQPKKNQDNLHYDKKKLDLLLTAIKNKKKVKLNNLYNRNNGKNNIKMTFDFRRVDLIILEGIYFLENIKNFKTNIYSIFIYENIYNCLIKKIMRIRDKKISIQNVTTEYINLHLTSFFYYLKNINFNLQLKVNENKFVLYKSAKKRQLISIKTFISKHSFKKKLI